jgi:pyruvate/2-oxoglutarate dehydrogenase complex dihydrolipoamide dehydrogenase (E3) component
MEAARVLSLKGHKVTLYEKDDVLGGLLNLASVPPYRGDIEYFNSYLKKQMDILGVNIKLNEEWNVKNEDGLQKYDVLIIAVGSTPIIPEIGTIDNRSIMTADEYIGLRNLTGKKSIIMGGGIIGLQCADLLTETNEDVEVLVIEKESSVARDVGNTEKKMILTRILRKGVRILLNAKVLKIHGNIVTVERDGLKENFSFDHIIFALGRSPRKITIPDSIKNKFQEIHFIGDCLEPRKIYDAVRDAFELGLKI